MTDAGDERRPDVPAESVPRPTASGGAPMATSAAHPASRRLVDGTSLGQLADATELVMHGEEAARAASFGRVVAILCAVGLALVTFDRTPLLQRGAMAIAQAVLGSVGAWVWWRSRDRGAIPVESFASYLPADVELVLGMALAKKPDSRFASATLFATALRDASSGVLDASIRKAAERILRGQPFRRESKDLPRSPVTAT